MREHYGGSPALLCSCCELRGHLPLLLAAFFLCCCMLLRCAVSLGDCDVNARFMVYLHAVLPVVTGPRSARQPHSVNQHSCRRAGTTAWCAPCAEEPSPEQGWCLHADGIPLQSPRIRLWTMLWGQGKHLVKSKQKGPCCARWRQRQYAVQYTTKDRNHTCGPRVLALFLSPSTPPQPLPLPWTTWRSQTSLTS